MDVHSQFRIGGMTCQNCAQSVREAIAPLRQVARVEVILEAALARVQWSEKANPTAVIVAVRAAGFSASLIANVSQKRTRDFFNEWKTSVFVAMGAFVFFAISEWIFGWHRHWVFKWFAFFIALMVQIYCGSRFYKNAWQQLKIRRSNMDTLVSLGSSGAFAYSAFLLFAGSNHALYFMESVGIIAFVSLGHFIEIIISKKASGAIESLMKLAPNHAIRILSNGQKSQVPIDALVCGDRILISPGEQIPADGIVIEGASACDESMLTGESVPMDKRMQSAVFAGTINLSGLLMVRVSGTAKETALAKIIAAVERAQNSRANIQRLADKISSIFVPIVVMIAIFTAIGWMLFPADLRAFHEALSPFLWTKTLPETAIAMAIIHAVSILIIACPCAMGLASPIAIMAGTNVAARHGILMRDGRALEQSGQITQVLFDKTGTLTRGCPSIEAMHWDAFVKNQSQLQSDLQTILVGIASPSKHPLSKAIAMHFDETISVKFASWKEISGKGIEAMGMDEAIWRLGSLNWFGEIGVKINGENDRKKHFSKGASVIGFAKNDKLMAILALTDSLKAGARALIQSLRQEGLEVSLVSGDNRETAQMIAKQLGISTRHLHSEISPEGKAKLIQKLQKSGDSVCFVGDGINDAPALEAADLGIAVGSASDIAKQSADILLLQSDLHTIPKALRMARATLLTIKQNLFWAFFYNASAIPLAALGFLNPLICAMAMGLSDLIVVGNALRLRYRRF